MSEEEVKEIIDKMSQEEYPYAPAIAKAYKKLEQENKDLSNVFSEFEKWLEEKIEQTKKQDTKEYHSEINLIIKTYLFVLKKLEELRNGDDK